LNLVEIGWRGDCPSRQAAPGAASSLAAWSQPDLRRSLGGSAAYRVGMLRLGQSGFEINTATARMVVIDAYLTNRAPLRQIKVSDSSRSGRKSTTMIDGR